MNVSFILTMQSKIDTSMFKALRIYKLKFRVPFGYQANGGLFKALVFSITSSVAFGASLASTLGSYLDTLVHPPSPIL